MTYPVGVMLMKNSLRKSTSNRRGGCREFECWWAEVVLKQYQLDFPSPPLWINYKPLRVYIVFNRVNFVHNSKWKMHRSVSVTSKHMQIWDYLWRSPHDIVLSKIKALTLSDIEILINTFIGPCLQCMLVMPSRATSRMWQEVECLITFRKFNWSGQPCRNSF